MMLVIQGGQTRHLQNKKLLDALARAAMWAKPVRTLFPHPGLPWEGDAFLRFPLHSREKKGQTHQETVSVCNGAPGNERGLGGDGGGRFSGFQQSWKPG